MTLNCYTRWKCEVEKYNMYFEKALSYAFTFFAGCLRNAQQFGNVQKNTGYVENNELPFIFALYLPLYFDKNAPYLAPYFLDIAPF